MYDASEGVTYSLSYSLNLDSNLSITEFANNEITVYYDDCEEVELPDCEDEVTYDCCASISFIANCQFDSDSNGICDEIDDGSVVLGCTSESACNYDSDADFDDGSCEYPEENYDCDGNCVVDEDCAGECGGGALVDECGVCEGPGAVYDCGCSDIPEGACDCDGNVLDECGVCQGDNSTCTGCTDQEACNYDADATINGECEYPDEGFDCNGNALNNDLTSPDSFEIVSIYPNPFNPSTHVRYALASTELIDIRVLNSNGNEIELLFSGYKIAGYHDFSWAPHSNTPSGHYFIQINTSNNSLIKKVTFLK